VTGNGVDTWEVDIFWGGARKNKNTVQTVATFKAKPSGEHSTPAQTQAFKYREYMTAKERAVTEMERLRRVDPVRKADAPKTK